MGAKLTNGAEILFRQIHPDLIQDGEPSSSNFCPKESDKDLLSVDRSTLTTAAAAFDLFTSNALKSVAVYGVSVDEFDKQGIPCEEDPLAATAELKANPSHALASFFGFGRSKQKTLAKRIKQAALARGVLHAAPIEANDESATGDEEKPIAE
jgi:hypothetical protein